MVLVIGSLGDPHVAAVVTWLKAFGGNVTLLDVYARESGGIFHRLSENVVLSTEGERVDLAEVTSVWWRQKAKFQVPSDDVTNLYDYYFVQREWNTFFDYLAVQTHHCWAVNNRANARLAENKLFQLELARRFDVEVPRTIFTNSGADAYNYFKTANVYRCVYKTFTPYIPPSAKIAYTTEIDAEDLLRGDYQETIDQTPGIFQERITASHELRVTVVGSNVFAAKVETPRNHRGTDWRETVFENHYSIVSLDKKLEATLLDLHRELGLVFAAYDFIVDVDDAIFFLEANPAGQWMWLEQKLGMPISKSVAQSLFECSA